MKRQDAFDKMRANRQAREHRDHMRQWAKDMEQRGYIIPMPGVQAVTQKMTAYQEPLRINLAAERS